MGAQPFVQSDSQAELVFGEASAQKRLEAADVAAKLCWDSYRVWYMYMHHMHMCMCMYFTHSSLERG